MGLWNMLKLYYNMRRMPWESMRRNVESKRTALSCGVWSGAQLAVVHRREQTRTRTLGTRSLHSAQIQLQPEQNSPTGSPFLSCNIDASNYNSHTVQNALFQRKGAALCNSNYSNAQKRHENRPLHRHDISSHPLSCPSTCGRL